MRTAWIFPGQGSLRTGCGSVARADEDAPAAAVTAAREVLDAASAVAGRDLVALADDAASGERTADAQPSILAVSLAVEAALRAVGLTPDVVAGHSLGELSAAVSGGAIDLEDGVRLVIARGEAMATACAATPGTLAAVVKLAPEAVDALLGDHPDVVLANDNAPGQVVLGGPAPAIEQLRDDVRAAGGRLVPLTVEGAFHSPAMASAHAPLEAALRDATVSDPAIALVSGVDARAHTTGQAIADGLLEGLLSPVRWREVQQALAADGVTHLIEVGPGGVLAGLAKRTVPDLELRTVAGPAAAAALAEELLAVPGR